MEAEAPTTKGRLGRVRKNLKQGLALAWAASPRLFLRYTLLGMFSAIMPPIAIYLGAVLVNMIADARTNAVQFKDVLPIIIGIWLTTLVQRAVGA